MRQFCFWVTSVVVGCTLTSVTAFGAPRVWTSPDGRYVVGFASEPKKHRLDAKGAVGVGYKVVEDTASGPVSYSLSISVSDAVKNRPPTPQIREMLELTTNTFLDAIGAADGGARNFKWSEFSLGGPALNYEATYENHGTPIVTRGYLFMDDISTVGLSISYPASLATKDRLKAADFLLSLLVNANGPVEPPIREFAKAVASGAGGTAVACPGHLVEGARTGLVSEGGSLLEMYCFAFDGSGDEVLAALEKLQVELAMGSRKGPWKTNRTGATVRVMQYGKEGVSWWIVPKDALTGLGLSGSRTIVLAQLVGERRARPGQ